MTGVLAVLAAGGGIKVTLVPGDAFGSGTSTGITTSAMQCVVSPPGTYSYQWIVIAEGIVANSPNSSTTTFTGFGMTPGETRESNVYCNVTQGGTTVQSEFGYVSVSRT